MKAHQGGFVLSTKYRLPVQLIHYEAFLSEDDAKRREKFLKGGNGKNEIAVMLRSYFEKNYWNK